jgi:hypothetical protein
MQHAYLVTFTPEIVVVGESRNKKKRTPDFQHKKGGLFSANLLPLSRAALNVVRRTNTRSSNIEL